jgi:uncharacterized protein YjbI with pentapeptide repeats
MKHWLGTVVKTFTKKGWPRRFLIAALAALIIILIWLGYAMNLPGLVASGNPKTAQYQPGKTVWDWLQLLIVPAVLAGAAIWFNGRQSKREQQATQEQTKIERELAQDQQRENALQAYLDHMADLLLKERLRGSAEDAEVRQIARVRTLTVLRTLDARRNAAVLRFLQEAGLREKEHPIVNLSDINLHDVALQGAYLANINLNGLSLNLADLREANLEKANLIEATLVATNLSRAFLVEANLYKATLYHADLAEAFLSEANLAEAKLGGANLGEADLGGANLSEADLGEANLSGAFLNEANLRGANLLGANLKGTHLRQANLAGAKVTDEQLKAAKNLEGATLPDGTKHP